MPTKYKKRLQQMRDRNAAAAEREIQQARARYALNSDSVIDRSSQRMQSDTTSRKKNRQRSAAYVKRKREHDTEYRKKNRQRSAAYMKRKREYDTEYRNQNRARAAENIKRRLNTDKEYRLKHSVQGKSYKKSKLMTDEVYHRMHVERAKRYRKRKLQTDVNYRNQNIENVKNRLKTNPTMNELNRRRALDRYRKISKQRQAKDYHRAVVQVARQDETTDLPSHVRRQLRKQRIKKRLSDGHLQRTVKRLTPQQRYWMRRTRLLALARQRKTTRQQQEKMHTESGSSMLDIRLLFNKAEQQLRQSELKVQSLHKNLSRQAADFLQYLPSDEQVTEDHLLTAFGGIRIHSSASETYFHDRSYRVLPANSIIPVDEYGKARIFDIVDPMEHFQNSNLPTTEMPAMPKTVKWHCNTQLCKISKQSINGVTSLFRSIAILPTSLCSRFYHHLDDCSNPARSDQMGHALHCTQDSQCHSLLRPARAIASHFPVLRSYVRRLYEIRQLVRHIEAVKSAMGCGNFTLLKDALAHLISLTDKLQAGKDNQDSDENNGVLHSTVDEETVMKAFGDALRQVETARDTYVTTSCDVCDQLRKDIKPLEYYHGKKGFDSDKMTEIVDQLYQMKTSYEDYDSFFQNMNICKYCADRLRANKDVARSCFNKLSVIPTPDCIKELNIFERCLIKFCMTCITVVRLGQVSNNKRPQNELTAALKGRIAYLPVDVNANATFLPENLLNVDSLVLLVGGQPTKQNKVWTSAVDLRKVHAALTWLRDNNRYYKDVPAYTVSDLQKILTDKLKPTADTDNCLLKKLDETSRSYLYENFSIQPLSSDIPADTLVDYQLNKLQGQSIDIFDSDLDVKAYPELYPTGENGMKDTRKVKIGTSEFIRNRLLNKDPKFRLNLNYLFHCFHVQEISNMCHSVGHMLRTVTGNQLSARSFLDRLQQKDGELHSSMFSLMANMRGTKEYYSKLGMDIRWMLRHIGPPTLFITCSIAEWFSEPLLNYIRTINSTVPGIQNMTPAELCAMDPVSVTIHLKQKWDAIFKLLIRNKQKPLFGEVQDYVTRLEYQSRGAGHVHCLLWIKGAPVLGTDSPDEVKQYIDSIITCSKPDPKTSPTLHNLVTKFQTHKCNKYCIKTYKRNGRFFKKCRFGFPRPTKSEIQINDVIDCLAVSKNNQPRKRVYNIVRQDDEKYINDYNPALLLANQANVDVQYIGHSGSRLPYYISDYITKYERSEQDAMWQDIFSSTRTLGTNAMSFLLKSLQSRQVGAHEAVDRLLGHKLYTKSRQMRFADLQPAGKAKRVLKSANDITQLVTNNPDCEDIFQPHWVLDVYPDRPDELENSSLHEVLSWYERQKNTGSPKETLKLKRLNYHLKRRTKTPYIVTHQIVNPNLSEKNAQKYYYFLLKLFKPWRSESDLCLPGKSYNEAFVEQCDNLPEMRQYHLQNMCLTKHDESEEQAVRERAEELRNNPEEADDEQTALEGCATDHIQTAMTEMQQFHSNNNTHSAEELQEMYNSLNSDQKRVVDKVVSHVCLQHRQLLLFISGQGGTGKSRVIDVLQQMVSQKTTTVLPVVVCAPTGLAAYSIHGTTIHRTLSLPVEHGKPSNYAKLNQEQLTLLRTTLKNLQLLIIDEISMVSSLTLLYIHLRLTEITGNNELFGGISVVFFADLLQLPPVKGNQPFVTVTSLEAKQRVGCIGTLDLWRQFDYDELTINMRQRGDTDYADLLSAVRVGTISDCQFDMLQQQLITTDGRRATVAEIADRYRQLSENGQNPIVLMPTVAMCAEVNTAMLAMLGEEIYTLMADDSRETIVAKKLLPKVQKAYDKISQDSSRTAGLEKKLSLCIGAKVMLKRNQNVDIGLVNGSIGIVEGFKVIQKNSNLHVDTIAVKFSHLAEPVNIGRESFSFEVLKSVYYTRRQFPIMLAFAITIHKSQGLSLHTAIVDAGSATFGPGMVYVALSRVTTLRGLHLIDLDRKKITCDLKAIGEYNRLRQTYMPHLGQLPFPGHDLPITTVVEPQSAMTVEQETERCGTVCGKTEEQASESEAQRRTEATDGNSGTLCQRIYLFCSIESIDTGCQILICNTMNLAYVPNEHIASAEHHISQQMAQLISSMTQLQVQVNIRKAGGDGNCLFRSLSYCITGSQQQFGIMRAYIVNHMLNSQNHSDLKITYDNRNQQSKKRFSHHLAEMEQDGTWGTEQEIIAAANLFDISIVTYNKYANNNYCLQHFSPHFAMHPNCTQLCSHKSVYLVNSSGQHYNPATVHVIQDTEQ